MFSHLKAPPAFGFLNRKIMKPNHLAKLIKDNAGAIVRENQEALKNGLEQPYDNLKDRCEVVKKIILGIHDENRQRRNK